MRDCIQKAAEQPSDTKRDAIFLLLVVVVYSAITAGRYTFNASIVSVTGEYGFTKAEAGSVWTFFEIPYGIGQFVTAAFSRRMNHRLFVFGALISASLATAAIPFCSSIHAMQAVWFINGAVQSVVWCAVIKTLSLNISQKTLPNAIVLASITYPVGNFIAYLTAAGSAYIDSWRLSFYAMATLMAATAILWIKGYTKAYYYNPINQTDQKNERRSRENKTRSGITVIIALFASVSFMGYFIKDGVNSWLPSMMHEAFKMEKSISIVMTLALPFAGAFASLFAKYLYRKNINHSTQLALATGIGAISAYAVLHSLQAHLLVWALVSCIVIFFFMAMITNVVTSMAPLNFRNRTDSGFFAGLASGCGHLGSAVGALYLGRVADKSGWNGVFLTVLAIALISTVISIAGIFAEKIITRRRLW